MDLRQPFTNLVCSPDDERSVVQWSHEMGRVFPPLRMTLSEPSFAARFRTVGASDFRLSDMAATPHQVVRVPETSSDDGSDYYKVTLQLAGRGVMSQGGREIDLLPGTIAVWDTGRAYSLRLDDDFRFLVALFPKAAVDMPPGLVGELTAMAVSSETGIGSVVAAYLRALSDNMHRLLGPAGIRLAHTGLDLLGTLFATELELAAGHEASRRSLLTEMCHFINANLSDPELSVASIADEFRVSPRHVHMLFQETGVGAARWIKRRRLEECRRDLADPLLTAESVHEIAARWGHPDSAYFSRIFKETFDESPSSWRRAQHTRAGLD